MDFKIAITCNVCKCGFELRPEFYSNLKAGVRALGEIPEFTGTDSEIFHNTGFSLQVKSYDELLSMIGRSTD